MTSSTRWIKYMNLVLRGEVPKDFVRKVRDARGAITVSYSNIIATAAQSSTGRCRLYPNGSCRLHFTHLCYRSLSRRVRTRPVP
jgi:hypothetical protein